MRILNPQNERIKRAYFTYLAEAKGFSEPTLDGVAKALNRFETYTKFRDFKAFHIEQAKGFKTGLAEQMSLRTKDRLSKATLYATLGALKRFFIWLAGQPGYKSRISYSDAEYFNLSVKETRIAKAHREERVPTLEQIRHVIRTMPAATDIERRDRALIAFTILTGARDGATASFKLKHIDIEQGVIDQDARQVNTKFSKSFATWFFPVGNDLRSIVADWVDYLHGEKLWGVHDPLFPATNIVVGRTNRFEVAGLDRKHWSSAGPIRKIFKDAFAAAGLPYFNPHSFRKTLATLGNRICKSPEEYKAWSQNLGHENVLTTFSSYGDVGRYRQAEIIRSLGARSERSPTRECGQERIAGVGTASVT
jgi:integrase